MLLGLIHALNRGATRQIPWIQTSWLGQLTFWTEVLVWVMVAFNLIRGIPVLWDGRFYLFDRYLPKELKQDA